MIVILSIDCLNDKDLTRVRKAIWEARSKWFDLGIELDISVETLMGTYDNMCISQVYLLFQYYTLVFS